MLREILDPIVNPQGHAKETAIKEIAAGTAIYRGRMANTAAARKTILAKPINELGASPKELNTHGRMNAAGIPVFYGSFDPDTCVAELRGPVGGVAIVGKFETLRPLRVLDLTLLKNAMFNISYFDEEVVRKFAYNQFLRGFHKEIRKPFVPGAESLDDLSRSLLPNIFGRRPIRPWTGSSMDRRRHQKRLPGTSHCFRMLARPKAGSQNVTREKRIARQKRQKSLRILPTYLKLRNPTRRPPRPSRNIRICDWQKTRRS